MSEVEILHSRATVVFNVTLVLAVVATVFVGLRITSKWIVVKRNNSDDVFTIIAWVGFYCDYVEGKLNDVGVDDGIKYSDYGRSKIWFGCS